MTFLLPELGKDLPKEYELYETMIKPALQKLRDVQNIKFVTNVEILKLIFKDKDK